MSEGNPGIEYGENENPYTSSRSLGGGEGKGLMSE